MARFTAQAADPYAEVPLPRTERTGFVMPPPTRRPAPHVALRSTPNPRDQTLSNVAKDWWCKLAPDLHPQELCLRYPRVANRLALCWNDAELTEQLFASLMVDRRGGRKGFPKVVLEELLRLRELVTFRVDMRGRPKVD